MTISASSMLTDIARYLSDYDEDESYVHWTQDDLLSYFKRAISIVAMAKRDRFVKRRVVKLKPGAVQETPEDCKSDISVQGVEKDGVVERVRRANLSIYPPLGRPMCRSKICGTGYKMKSFDIDPTNRRSILVDPPVPDGADVSLVLTCYMPPTVDSVDSTIELGQDLEAVVFELMLYYAWGVDIEDVANRERSNQHWNNAMTLLQLDVKLTAIARKMR